MGYLDHVAALVHELSEVADRGAAALHAATTTTTSLGECAPALRSPAAGLCHLNPHQALSCLFPSTLHC